ncbi:alpha/beta hydrolase family protein [Dyella tabacisoli]|nr:S9 family peptidase [Dyella tabacisoli]
MTPLRTCITVAALLTFALPVGAEQAPAAKAPPPIADFVRHAEFSQVTLSPDGQYIAAVVPNADKNHENYLAILDGKTAKPLQKLPAGPNHMIHRYTWVTDQRLVVSLAQRLGGLDTPMATGELYASNADGSRMSILFGYRGSGNTGSRIKQDTLRYAAASLISDEPINDNQVLIATREFSNNREGNFTGIEKLNVMTGRTMRIGTSPARDAAFIADHQGQVRVAYASENFTRLKLWTRASNEAEWQLANDPVQSGITLRPVGFNRDNSKLYVESSQGAAPNAIELMDLTSGKRARIYQGKFADPVLLLPSADRQDYYAVITADGPRALHYIDEDSREAQLTQALAKNFPGELAYFSSFSRDGKRAIVHVLSDRNPGDYYVFDLDTRNARYLVSASRWIDPQQMRPKQLIELQARDGLSLHGFLTLPAGDKPYPLIVLPHGGPFGIADDWNFDPEAQLFASRGYAVLQVNYRGSGGYGARFEQRGYRQWGLAMQDDLTDATHWAVQQGYTQNGRICIYGASYGGYAALQGAVREPDLYRCAIGYAGVYDMRVQLDSSDTQRIYNGEGFLRQTMGDDRDDLLRRSPLGGVERLKADVLLIHGGEDQRVPLKNFRIFTQALDKLNKPYDSLVEPDEGHGFFLEKHRQQAYEKMLNFLDRNIGPSSTQAGTTN